MNLKELHEFFVGEGIKADPRGEKEVKKVLAQKKKEFNELKEKDKKDFDRDGLWNPYPDTQILNGSGKEKIKTILLGIDMEVSEILLAERLKEKGKKIDLVLAHHPEGKALANLYSVMKMQANIMSRFGVPINVAEGVMSERISQVERGLSAVNHTRSQDAARLLGIPYMCCHTASDNHVESFLQKLLDKEKPEKVSGILKILKEIPEYVEAMKHGAGPKIFIGSPENSCGKVYVEMTGGTEPSKDVYEKMVQAGVGTVVGMHLSEDSKKAAEKNKFNYVVAGHISSDTIGLNLLLDKLEKKGKFEFIECSGFRRIKRK